MATSSCGHAASLDPRILKILRCPVTEGALTQRGDVLVVVDDQSIRYPIQHGVPTLLPDSAEPEGHP